MGNQDLCIQTVNHIVSVPKYEFILKSKAMRCFNTITDLWDLKGIFVYQDRTIRLTYSHYVSEHSVPDSFESEINEDIKRIL